MDQKYLKSILHYCPISGELTWVENRGLRYCKGKKAGAIHRNKDGKSYLKMGIDGRTLMAHRVIWMMRYGEWPNQIDHINGNGLDNTLSNLRNVTSSQNNQNRRISVKNSSGIVGVSKARNLWCAKIGFNGVVVRLGYFKDKFEAICARKSAENKYGFHPNHGTNRPL